MNWQWIFNDPEDRGWLVSPNRGYLISSNVKNEYVIFIQGHRTKRGDAMSQVIVDALNKKKNK